MAEFPKNMVEFDIREGRGIIRMENYLYDLHKNEYPRSVRFQKIAELTDHLNVILEGLKECENIIEGEADGAPTKDTPPNIHDYQWWLRNDRVELQRKMEIPEKSKRELTEIKILEHRISELKRIIEIKEETPWKPYQ